MGLLPSHKDGTAVTENTCPNLSPRGPFRPFYSFINHRVLFITNTTWFMPPPSYKNNLFLSTKKRSHYFKNSTNRGHLQEDAQIPSLHQRHLSYLFQLCSFHAVMILATNSINAFSPHSLRPTGGSCEHQAHLLSNTFEECGAWI